jgi:tetratricopeptide (TPR) repeat protein
LTKYELKDYDGALLDSYNALEYKPKGKLLLIIYNNFGLIYNKLKDYTKALENFNKSIEINPKYTNAYINRANTKYYLEDYDGVVLDCNISLNLKPNNEEKSNNYVR